MKFRKILLLVAAAAIAGCVAGYTLVQPGANTVADLRIDAGAGWNRAPSFATSTSRASAETWTQDGLLLDRLVIVPAVADGEPLLRSKDESAALPPFRKDMLPNEIEELMESTLVKYFGEGNVSVSTQNLRPQLFGGQQGVMFDMSARITESPDYMGTVGAFIANDKLYAIWYIAADPYYFGKHSDAAEAIIKSAKLQGQNP